MGLHTLRLQVTFRILDPYVTGFRLSHDDANAAGKPLVGVQPVCHVVRYGIVLGKRRALARLPPTFGERNPNAGIWAKGAFKDESAPDPETT
jgi:hypothetical protein